MQSHSGRYKAAAAALSVAAWLALAAAPAAAAGTAVIVQNDGHSDRYVGVKIKIIHNALYVTSEDGKGTIVITRAACSYQGDLLVCLTHSGALVQSGTTKSLDLRHGTLYVNNTDSPAPLVMSTAKVPPHSIMLSFTTDRGTYVSLSGRIDKVVK
ncbi:MAG TPA: hypothetical protein VHX17_08240 [Candidatus Cybelea sp.]|jgi:hypothetical protein|nr:hypothetical protein [Candidatus Cybelea sp.]